MQLEKHPFIWRKHDSEPCLICHSNSIQSPCISYNGKMSNPMFDDTPWMSLRGMWLVTWMGSLLIPWAMDNTCMMKFMRAEHKMTTHTMSSNHRAMDVVMTSTWSIWVWAESFPWSYTRNRGLSVIRFGRGDDDIRKGWSCICWWSVAGSQQRSGALHTLIENGNAWWLLYHHHGRGIWKREERGH